MKRITVAVVGSCLLLSNVVLFSGCSNSATTDKMNSSQPKMGMEKMSEGKMGSEGMSGGKMADGKMSDGKMSDSKMSDGKMSGEK